jgi:hypothetical protein
MFYGPNMTGNVILFRQQLLHSTISLFMGSNHVGCRKGNTTCYVTRATGWVQKIIMSLMLHINAPYQNVMPARRGIKFLKHNGHYIYQHFNIHKLKFLPTRFMCFVWITEQIAIISLHRIN